MLHKYINDDFIESMNLFEDGLLVIQTDRRRKLLQVTSLDNFEHLSKFILHIHFIHSLQTEPTLCSGFFFYYN
ncbi:DUF986 family protein [Heyndrickxia ginsengihumi]|uniref:DUF986 family protein n=1 Tax=Heyndrickxia ginsengihumi TaxID=363870 RepID=UPI0009E03CFF|nr:DUF986 family protein [Heyndrickxia ginsengihumi]